MRPRLSPADFLRDWGATTVQADLTDPSSLPAALVGVSTVIDCATARPEESTDKVRPGAWPATGALCGRLGKARTLAHARVALGATLSLKSSKLLRHESLTLPATPDHRPPPTSTIQLRLPPPLQIDWEGKVALIQCAQAMGIQR